MSAITTIVVLPLLIVVLTTTLELGSLRVVAGRAHSAADLAALVAINDQDDEELARSGRLVPAADAAEVARTVFAQNLEPIASALAADPRAIAAAATIAVETIPPTLRIDAVIPIRTPFFAALFLHPITNVAITASGGAR